MNAIEIKGLSKSFKEKQAVCGLDMTVPEGAIYGFIGENGSGKSTTQKLICGLIHPTSGSIRLFGKDHMDPAVKAQMSVLIEAPGCFPNYTVWNNLLLQAANLGIKDAENQVRRVLKLVRMEGAAGNKYKNCSLGMKQRIGIAMALLGEPRLLILDEPINGLDVDGMRLMRQVLVDIAANGATILISSHVLGELEKVATHYGIIRRGRMIRQMTAKELEDSCRTYVSVKAEETSRAKNLLGCKYSRVEEDDTGCIRVYDEAEPAEIVTHLYENGILVSQVKTEKIGLEEYYTDLMKEGE